ncbi:unnamed protein product [Trichobilharzia regenti]|nr:unnamed protein product [Trichobilharzia regenti]
MLPITAHSPPYTSSLNSISILEESSTDVPTIVYKSLLTSPHGKLKTTRTTMVESLQMTSCYSTKLNYSQNEELSTSSLPPFSITLHVECSLSSVSGEIHLSHSSLMNSDEQPVSLHWSVDNVQLILEIQKECCSIDFHVGSCSAFIQKSTE